MRRIANTAFALLITAGFAADPISSCWAKGTTHKHRLSEAELGHQRAAVVRAYVMNGLLGELFTSAMSEIGEKLRARGAIVQVGSWTQESSFVADACAHSQDRIIFIGHSLGAVAAAGAVGQANACGVKRLSMVGIDPPNMGAAVPNGTHAVNFVGELNASITGAQNVPVPGLGHIEIVNDPTMQNRIVAAALR
jgi:hypothetical protein